MRSGELITNPNDKRQFKNMFYERLQDKDRIFHQDKFWNMDEQSRRRYSEHYTNYKNKLQGMLPTKTELNLGVIKGDYIYMLINILEEMVLKLGDITDADMFIKKKKGILCIK